MDENIYLKIIYNLKEIDYSNNINFHRFNEPLSQKELIINRIKQARFNLPKAIIGIFTNGDYLTKEYLDELKDAGVNSVYDRTFRCFFPFTDLYIDYNGYCMPCCHLRSDIESHQNFILGNIYDSNLFEIFTNQKTVELRKYLCVNSKKISPCSKCEAETEYRFINLVN